MGADRRAVLQNAQSLASRGQIDGAIAEWRKLLSNSPSDAAVHNSIGDLELKRNAPKDAIAAYSKAAEAFRAVAEPLKAIAAYKKILKLDPARAEVYRHLGDLNAERGLVSSAVAEYSTLAKLYTKGGQLKQALEIYRIIIRHDSANIVAQQQLAELCAKQGLDVDQLLNIPDEAPTGSPSPESAPSAGEPGQPAASDREGSLAGAIRHLDQGEFARAEEILSQLLNHQPGDPEICRLLARLHLKRGDSGVAQNEYVFLAGAALRADDFELAESLVKEYLEVESTCAPLLEMLGAIHEKRGNPETAALQYGKALQVLLEHPDPDLPTLPEELYHKIKELDPTSFLVAQFGPAFEDQPAVGQSADAAGVESQESAIHEGQPSSTETVETGPADIFVSQASDATVDQNEQAGALEEASQANAEEDRSVVAEQGDDLDTHQLLGKAYKAMGLFNEAIEEFRLSMTGPHLFLDSCADLAACLKERGMNGRAIACLEHVLADPRCEGERMVAIRYELGLLYEAEGLLDRALRTFETISTFQDAGKRIEWIKGGGSQETHARSGVETPVGAGKSAADGPTTGRKKRRISYL